MVNIDWMWAPFISDGGATASVSQYSRDEHEHIAGDMENHAKLLTSPICTRPTSSVARQTTNVSKLGSSTMFSSRLVLVKDLKLDGICRPRQQARAKKHTRAQRWRR